MKLRGLIVVAVISSGLVACDKDKPTQKEMVNACLFDPTGNCQKQAAALAQGQAPALLPYINAAGANQGGATQPAAGKVAVSSAEVNATAAKVQAAIKADNLNPNSLHYDPPQSSAPKASAADVQAVKSLPTQNDQMGLTQVISGVANGDAVR